MMHKMEKATTSTAVPWSSTNADQNILVDRFVVGAPVFDQTYYIEWETDPGYRHTISDKCVSPKHFVRLIVLVTRVRFKWNQAAYEA